MAPGTDPLATLSAAGASDAPPQPPPTTTGTPTETTPPVTVTTGAPGQVNPVAMAQQMLQPDATPSYQQPTMEPEHEAWWRRALDQVGSIMGGDQTIHITKDPQGNVSVTHDPSTGKEKWARVAAAALSGAARGMAVGQGPGGAGRAVAAGFQQGEQQQQKQLDAANAQAANMNQQMLAKANHALLDQKILQEQFRTKAEPITFSQQQAEYASNMATKMQDIGARKIGSVKNSSELVAFGNTNPDAIAAHTGASDDVVMPIPQPDGSTDMYLIPANTAKRLNPAPHTYHRAVLDDQNVGKVKWIDYTEQGNTKSFGDQALADKALIDANNNTIKTAQERGTAEQEAQTKANEATNKQPLVRAQTAEASSLASLHGAQAEAARRTLSNQPGGVPVEVEDPNYPSPVNFPTGTLGIAKPPKTGDYKVPADADTAYRLSTIMRDSGNNIRQIATSNPQLFGRLQGLLSQGKTIVGLSGSKDDQAIASLAGSIQQYAQASAGFHKFRNKAAPAETEESSLNKFRNDPASIVAFLDSQKPALDQTDHLIRNYQVYGTAQGPSTEARAAAVARAPNAAKFAGGGGAPAAATTAPAAPAGAARQIPPGARAGRDAQGNVVGYQDATGWHNF